MLLLLNFVNLLFRLLNLAVLIRVLLTWVSVDPYHPVVRVLHQITDPILEPLRRVLPPVGMLDISPMVALVLLEIVRSILMSALVSLAY